MWRQIIVMASVHLDRILDTISYFVKSKKIIYDADSAPEGLVYTLTTSTYWLRDAIFDPNGYKYNIKNSNTLKNYEKLNIAKYYDIGTTLIKKGFNFNPTLDGTDDVTVPYASFYLQQCLKRQFYFNRAQR